MNRLFKSVVGLALILTGASIAMTGFYGESMAGEETFEDPFPVVIDAKTINNFKIGYPGEKRFGSLEFVGGLELLSPNPHLGALSGVSLVPEKNLLFAIADTGFWLAAKTRTMPNGQITALNDVQMVSIRGEDGAPLVGKWKSDAESVQVVGDMAYISFERDNRVTRLVSKGPDLVEGLLKAPAEPIGPDFSKMNIRGNKGLEAVAVDLGENGNTRRIVTISERTLDQKGNNLAFLLEGNKAKAFAITHSNDFDITDAAFLPDGDLVILERRFNMSSGAHMRIRRLPSNEIAPGKTADGKILMQADMSYQIDNMEGLDIHINDAGEAIFTMVSDDNHSLLQRNLLLQFKLLGENFALTSQLRPSFSQN